MLKKNSMIGIFGQFYLDNSKEINLDNMISRIPDRIKKKTLKGKNFHIGIANHDLEKGCSFYKNIDGSFCFFIGEAVVENDLKVVITAEFLLNLIENGKISRISKLNGMFSAIIGQPKKNTYTFVSDRLGSWPLFIWHEKDHYIFSSNLYALLGCKDIIVHVDTEAVVELFSFNRTIGSTSPIRGVEYFTPATVMEVNNLGIKRNIYWSLEFFNPKFKLEEAPYLFAEALKKTMLKDAEGGLLLSGGLDSRLILAASPKNSLSSWTTASYKENPELDIAKKVACSSLSKHKEIIVEPQENFEILDDTVKANNGMFPASTIMSTFLPKVAQKENIIVTGHGLDYTFRGYYLPAKYISLMGSNTRLPVLKNFNSKLTGESILENLRQGSPLETVEKIFGGKKAFHEHRIVMEKKIYSYLEPWIKSEYPENAWDAFILKSVSQHYAFTSMMPIRNLAILRIPAFDINVINIYQNLLPQWRISGDISIKALKLLSLDLAKINNANTLMKATLDPKIEILALFARAAARKIGLFKKPKTPSLMHSYRSWHDASMLYRLDSNFKKLIKDIQERLDWLCCGVLSVDDLNKCIVEHQTFKKDHTKLIRQLITHDSWMRISQ